MVKFPEPPDVGRLREIAPEIVRLPRHTTLACVYATGGAHPVLWNEFRHFGPLDARWDHHLPNADGAPRKQQRGIVYAANSGTACLAEYFQATRVIDRSNHMPWLVVFDLAREAALLDLSGAFATRIGASQAIHSGSRGRARAWARLIHGAYPKAHGILYRSAMLGGSLAVAFNERAARARLLPAYPRFNRPLADPSLDDALDEAARMLGYELV